MSIILCLGTGVGMEEEPLMLRIAKREKLIDNSWFCSKFDD